MIVTVVIPALDEGDNLVDTAGCVLENSEHENLEVIIVDDGSQDGSAERALAFHGNGRLRALRGGGLGVAGARNRGAQEARGEVIVFLDGHCYVPPGWLEPLVTALGQERAGMVGPAFTSIHHPLVRACGVTWRDASLERDWLPCGQGVSPVPLQAGGCQAVRADAFHQVGGYDNGMTRWGHEDLELAMRMWLSGYRVYAQPASLVYHLFRNKHPYPVDHSQILYNKLRLALLHFDGERLGRILRRLLSYPGIERILARAFTDGTLHSRQKLMAIRKYDTGWFCNQFQIRI